MSDALDTFADAAHGGGDGAFLEARTVALALSNRRAIGVGWRVERLADGWRIVAADGARWAALERPSLSTRAAHALLTRLSLDLAFDDEHDDLGVVSRRPIPHCMARRAQEALRAAGLHASWASDTVCGSTSAWLYVRPAG